MADMDASSRAGAAARHGAGITDQAAGLRRLMSSPLAAVCTVLSANGRENKPVLVSRLAASMARRGHPVMVLEACPPAANTGRTSLLDVAQGRAAIAQARVIDAEGIAHFCLGSATGSGLSDLTALLQQLAAEGVRLLVDAELDADGQLPLAMLADGEIVVQLSGNAAAIRDAYDMLRALKGLCGRGTVSLLVTDVDPVRARNVHANLFHAASRYLALRVRSITAPPPARRAPAASAPAVAGVELGATGAAASATQSGNRHV